MKTSQLTVRSLIMIGFIVALSPYSVNAQKPVIHDSSYYETFPNKMTTRLYLSQKFVRFTVPTEATGFKDVEYNANPKLNLGMGFTVRNLSLNIFYGFSFLNKKDTAKGKTTGLDLQLHLYPRKWAIDLLIVSPKGFYLTPKGYGSSNPSRYYSRRDVKLSLFDVSVYRVPNKEKFSYRAAITQNEWQKKSAGSPLYGGEIYYGSIKGDSALVPKMLQSGFPQAGVNQVSFFSINPGIGYAYTAVISHHYYITGSLIGNLDINFSTEKRTGSQGKKSGITPSTVYKASIGYNSSTWDISANITGGALWAKSASSTKNYFLPTGNYRLVLSRKLELKKHHKG